MIRSRRVRWLIAAGMVLALMATAIEFKFKVIAKIQREGVGKLADVAYQKIRKEGVGATLAAVFSKVDAPLVSLEIKYSIFDPAAQSCRRHRPTLGFAACQSW